MRAFALACIASLAATAAQAAEEEFSDAKLVRLGKDATALIEMGSGALGTSFCVHPSGIFVTNQHVVSTLAEGQVITLHLRPGETGARKVKARLLRSSRDLDLALLQAVTAAAEPFASLEVGSAEKLIETTRVMAFGFPFGKALSRERDRLPAVSVSMGRINAFRRKAGKIDAIQLDAVLNPGNSGGPVIDRHGRVIGIVRSGILGVGINFAIPADKLRGLLEEPVVRFIPPKVTVATSSEPAEFIAEVICFDGQDQGLSLELVLGDRDRERRVKLQGKDGRYSGKAVPVPALGPRTVTLDVRYAKGRIRCVARDRSFTVAGTEVRLSEVVAITFGPEPEVEKVGGEKLKGPVSGLGATQVDLGQVQTVLALDKSQSLRVERPAGPADIRYAIKVRRGGELVRSVEGRMPIVGAAGLGSAGGAFAWADGGSGEGVVIRTSDIGGRREVRMRVPISDCVVGGGGRYFALLLAKARQIAVLDISRMKVACTVPLPKGRNLMAAGLEKLIVVSLTDRRVTRYAIDTGKMEVSRPVPVVGVVDAIALGNRSKGPLLMRWSVGTGALDLAHFSLVDIETFKASGAFGKRAPHYRSHRDVIHLRSSPEGSVFGMWATSHSPSGLATASVGEEGIDFRYEHNSVGLVLPGANGRVIYTCRGPYSSELKPIKSLLAKSRAALIPAVDGESFLALAKEGESTSISLMSDVGGPPLATTNEASLDATVNSWRKDDFTLDKRIFYLPSAKRLVIIPDSVDRVTVRPFGPGL